MEKRRGREETDVSENDDGEVDDAVCPQCGNYADDTDMPVGRVGWLQQVVRSEMY